MSTTPAPDRNDALRAADRVALAAWRVQVASGDDSILAGHMVRILEAKLNELADPLDEIEDTDNEELAG
jgi:hypothetical protein